MVASDSPIASLKAINGKEIAVVSDERTAILLQKYPGVVLRSYSSIPDALNAIVRGEVDGALINILSAVAYCQDLYQNKLKIVTPVLNNEGLRLITLHQDAGDWVSHFNRGLAKLKTSGAYDKLLLKWGLKERCEP
jgi:polar amino acid transport system substrate-binding protein